MNGIWQALIAHISKNWEAYSSATGLIVLAGIAMMPEKRPQTLDEWWAWFRNTLQTATPARFHPPSNPTQAVEPPQPKK